MKCIKSSKRAMTSYLANLKYVIYNFCTYATWRKLMLYPSIKRPVHGRSSSVTPEFARNPVKGLLHPVYSKTTLISSQSCCGTSNVLKNQEKTFYERKHILLSQQIPVPLLNVLLDLLGAHYLQCKSSLGENQALVHQAHILRYFACNFLH